MKMDETWSIFDFAHNEEEFGMEFVPDFYLKPVVHKDVVENFRVIQKLIEYSFYEYKFYDVATLKSLLTFEMSLKIRYEEINAIKWGKQPLAQLIGWFEKKYFFEVYNKEYLESVRYIRNVLAHPAEHTVSGPNGKHIIENVRDLINGLYEDPLLRKDRMDITMKIINTLNTYQKGIKCTIDNTVYYAFNAWPAFVNNKITPSEIYFYFHPTFNFPQGYIEAGNTWIHPVVIPFKGCSIQFNDSSIQMKNSEGSTLLISEIQDINEKKEFDDWKNEYESYCYPGLGYFFPNGKQVDTFSFHLRDFYKM
jgi:hypothetical protein